MLIEGADYFIRLITFPTANADGLTLLNPDGTYSIYLRADKSRIENLDGYEHELMHILKDDFYNGTPIQFAEAM